MSPPVTLSHSGEENQGGGGRDGKHTIPMGRRMDVLDGNEIQRTPCRGVLLGGTVARRQSMIVEPRE